MSVSWNEVETIAAKAARGAGVPPAQATRFGAAAARHLAEGRAARDLSAALTDVDRITRLALEIERGVEHASVSAAPYVPVQPPDGLLLVSFFQSLPCAVEVTRTDAGDVAFALRLGQPGGRERPARLDLPDDLRAQMAALADRLLVPETEASRLGGAGAGVIDSD